MASNSKFSSFLHSSRISRGLVWGILILSALIAFEEASSFAQSLRAPPCRSPGLETPRIEWPPVTANARGHENGTNGGRLTNLSTPGRPVRRYVGSPMMQIL